METKMETWEKEGLRRFKIFWSKQERHGDATLEFLESLAEIQRRRKEPEKPVILHRRTAKERLAYREGILTGLATSRSSDLEDILKVEIEVIRKQVADEEKTRDE